VKNKLYIAYGSNLNFAQMGWRCPTARFIGSGIVDGYRLAFKGDVAAVATIEEADGCQTPVGVWEIKPADEQSLDVYEGYPRLYQKRDIEVSMASGGELTGMVYTIGPSLGYGIPARSYYNAIAAGYENCGLDAGYLHEAFTFSALKAEENRYGQLGFFDGCGSVNEETKAGPEEETLDDGPVFMLAY